MGTLRVLPFSLGEEPNDGQHGQNQTELEKASPGVMAIVWHPKMGKGRCLVKNKMEEIVHVRPAVKRNFDVKDFLAVNKDPVEVRQHGKKNPPLESPPPDAEKTDGGDQHVQMITHPKWVFKICLGWMVGYVGQAIEQAVRQKGGDRRDRQGKRAGFDPLQRPLNDHSGQNVGWLLQNLRMRP